MGESYGAAPTVRVHRLVDLRQHADEVEQGEDHRHLALDLRVTQHRLHEGMGGEEEGSGGSGGGGGHRACSVFPLSEW